MNEDFQDNQEEKTPEKETKEINPIMSPVTAAFFGLAAVFVLYQFGGAILTLAIFGMDFEKADVNAVRLLTMGGQILLILLPALLFTRFIYHDVSSIIKVKFPSVKEIGIFTIGLILLTPLLQSYVYIQNFVITKLAENFSFVKSTKDLVDQLDKLVESTYGSLLASHSIFEASFIVVAVAVVPAVCEETFFRGFVLNSFRLKYKPFWSALITGIFFGLYHFNPYGLIPLIALGVYFGFAAYTSNSIFVPMALHFLNNFFAVVMFLALGDDELISSSVTVDQSPFALLVSFLILSGIFFLFITYLKKNYHKFAHPIDLDNTEL